MRPSGSVILAVVALALGCGPSEAPTSEAPTSEAPAPPSGATPPEAAPAGEAPAGEAPPSSAPAEGTAPSGGATGEPSELPPCERARACCRAYVAALPSARRPLEERGCSEMDAVLGEAGESSADVCEAAIGGWRQSLQLTGLDVPDACR
jgi:hypothetical protein